MAARAGDSSVFHKFYFYFTFIFFISTTFLYRLKTSVLVRVSESLMGSELLQGSFCVKFFSDVTERLEEEMMVTYVNLNEAEAN